MANPEGTPNLNEKEKLVSFLRNMGILFRVDGNRIKIGGSVLLINDNEIEILHDSIRRIRIIKNAEYYKIEAKVINKSREIILPKNISIQYIHPDLFIDL